MKKFLYRKYYAKHVIIEMFKDIKDFHTKFDLEYEGSPRELEKSLQEFRIKFLTEELIEYKLAVENNDLEAAFDALIDLVYVALGTAYMHGFNFEEGWKLVHEANMKKVRAKSSEDSKRSHQTDVVKPEGWKSPDLKNILNDKDVKVEYLKKLVNIINEIDTAGYEILLPVWINKNYIYHKLYTNDICITKNNETK